MREHILPPHAASLSQSMRDIGYSLETAIADLIDNSITAGAESIQIFLDTTRREDPPCLVIIDNGSGMSEIELLEAMRPGSQNPRDRRESNDLGRFGLGLKTASFSQCKCLTVLSRKDQQLSAAQWDLDLLNVRNEWVVNILDPDELEDLPYFSELGSHGTYILWQKMDRLLEGKIHEQSESKVYEKFAEVEKHLSLVFHRYLSGEYKKRKVAIQINGHSIEAFDPFCISNKATQLLPEEIIRIDGHVVKIQPYILPHHSKLSKKEYEFYSSRNDFVSNQGAYIYRNGRLMTWGDWFRLVPKSEATKLARIRIDFTNVLDELWTIDIKKSRAHPPEQVKHKLRQIINRITEQSKLVHIGRGNRLFDEHEQRFWERFSDRSGIRYAINRIHPLVIGIESKLDAESRKAFQEILSIIERSVPLEAIYSDYSSSPQNFEEKLEIPYEELKEKIQSLYMLLYSDDLFDKESFMRMICGLKPFSENIRLTQKIIEGLL